MEVDAQKKRKKVNPANKAHTALTHTVYNSVDRKRATRSIERN